MSEPEDSPFDFDREFNSLKISALKSVVDISPYVHEVTIGPNAVRQNGNSSPVVNHVTPKANKVIANGDEAVYISPRIQHNKSNDSSLLIDHLLHECEVQQTETLNIMVKSMLNKMVTKRSEMMTRFWHQQELEYERKAEERRNREREILQQLALDDKMAQLEQERLDMENKAHSERMRKLLEKQLESTRMFEQLDSNHSQICSLYQDITNIAELDNKEVYVKILQKYDHSLTNSLANINALAESFKSGNIGADDVAKSEMIKNKMKEIQDNVIMEYKTALSKIEETKQTTITTNSTSQPTINTSQATINTSQHNRETSSQEKPLEHKTYSYCSKRNLDYYLELQQYLESYEGSYKDLMNDNSFKKFRFECQKAVNIPVNSISSVSGSHLKDKFDKLAKLLNGDRVQVGDIYVQCSVHPQGKAYCMNLLAKKIVRQGEQTVSSNPDAAFPIASVTVALWAKFPELGKLICAHFHKECPYLIPMFLPQSEGLSDADYYKARGYRYDENNAVEKQDKFLKRMSGIFRLNAAIWIAKMPYSVKLPHPHGLLNAWRWMASFINLNPEPDITATLLFDFLSLCGADFFKYYKHQFVKVLQYLVNDYRKRIDKIDEGGPKVRLEVFLQNVIKDGKIPPPKGVVSDRVW